MPQRETDADLLARLDAALARGEVAAGRLDSRHRQLRTAARAALDLLDRLAATPGGETPGGNADG